VLANILLGFSQGLTWSSTVVMKIDIAGKQQRGLAVGLNESIGYLSLGLAAWLTASLAATYGLRPIPFYPGVVFAFAGLFLSFMVRETLPFAVKEHERQEEEAAVLAANAKERSIRLWPMAQAGLINNLNDVLMWGLLPVMLSVRGFDLASIALISSIYPIVWALLQFGSGTLSDRIGTRALIVLGMVIQGLALTLVSFASNVQMYVLISVLLGVGTALSYPTLLAAVSHAAPTLNRTRMMGIYRFWRDMGFVFGAAIISFASSLEADQIFSLIGVLTIISGIVYQTTTHD
jgi:MFS family permease